MAKDWKSESESDWPTSSPGGVDARDTHDNDMVDGEPAVETDCEKENNTNGGEREIKKVELGATIILSAPE